MCVGSAAQAAVPIRAGKHNTQTRDLETWKRKHVCRSPPSGQNTGVWPGPSPGLWSPPGGGYPKRTRMFLYKCLQHVPLPSCRDPWPNGQWSTTEHGWGNLFYQDAGRQGAREVLTPKHKFPLRIHSKLCRIQSGLGNLVPDVKPQTCVAS